MVDHADRDLATEQLPEMNREFYSTNPTKYFRTRLDGLMLVAARSDLLAQGLRETLEIGSLKVSSADTEYASNEDIEHYVATEAVIVLHHASEVLLRLFFAHEHQPPCPWLEASRLRGPRQFKDRLDQLVAQREEPDQVNRISLCFLGRPAASANTPDEDDSTGLTMADALEGAVELLVLTADRLTRDGNLYNAAKHGLAVLPAERGVSLGDHDGPVKLSAHGQSLKYLERAPLRAGGPNTWHQTTTWVRPEHYLAWAHLVVRLMGSIWTVGTMAYTGEPGQLLPISPEMVHRMMKGVGEPGAGEEVTVVVDTMREQLAYYAEPPGEPGIG